MTVSRRPADRALQLVSALIAVTLVAVETFRSWGVDRPTATVADDWVGGGLLLWAAWLTGRPDHRARRIVTAIWGVLCGASISNFAIKLLMPDRMTPGNLPPVLLQALVGGAVLVTLVCLCASILLPVDQDGQTVERQ